jgi:hypothetical protein
MWKSLYCERTLQEIWEKQLFRRDGLLTEDAQRVTAEFPGFRSVEGGPDFRDARIAIGGERRAGDVEIHLTPSGWEAHGHARDGAYAGVILHVVLRRDPFVEPPRDLPLLVLEPYLHAEAAREVSGPPDFDALGEEWFEARRRRLLRARERRGDDEVLHREILIALGYKHNQAAMAEVAARCPFASLRGKSSGEIEARLRRAAESLPRAAWRIRNVRPANHPWRRLSGMARFLAAAGEEGLARGLAARATLEEMAAWLDPDGAGQIGRSRAIEIALNVFIPFLGGEAWRRVANGRPPHGPGVLAREFPGSVTTVRRYFGALRALKFSVFRPRSPVGGPMGTEDRGPGT